MESVLTALKDTPIPTILVIAGIVFLLLSIAGQLAGRIAIAPERQRWAAVIGGVLLMTGVVLHVVPQVSLRSRGAEEVPTSQPFTPPPKAQPASPPGLSPSRQSPPSEFESSRQASTEDKEPNNDIANATLITEGTAVRGSIAADQDRDFFKFNATNSKTRVILRKQFYAYIDVYNHSENKIASDGTVGDETISFSFESSPGLLYYILVKPGSSRQRGDYELVIREE